MHSRIAVHGTALASSVLAAVLATAFPTEPTIDLNRDGYVDCIDLRLVLQVYGSHGKTAADFNRDNQVDAADLIILLECFGPVQG